MRSTAMMKCFERGPFLDHVAAALALEHVGNLFEHFSSELAAIEILVPERDAEAQDRGRCVVDVLIELLGPEPHFGSAKESFGASGGSGKVSSIYSRITFDSGMTLLSVNQGGNDGAAVELAIPSLLMLAGA